MRLSDLAIYKQNVQAHEANRSLRVLARLPLAKALVQGCHARKRPIAHLYFEIADVAL